MPLDCDAPQGYFANVIFVARCFIVACLMVSIGAQWAVLQGVAWVGMAVSYSVQDGSITEGLSKTFDGAHPCPLCKAVKKGVKDEQGPAQDTKTGKGKSEILETSVVSLYPPIGTRLLVSWESSKADTFQRDVPLPPPRLS